MPESSIVLVGGPHDGRIHALEDSHEVDGEPLRREGWPLIIEFRNSAGDIPLIQAVAQDGAVPEGWLVVRYRLTAGGTPEGYQVYEHIPD
jgi:hypothetical protein